MTTDSCQPPAPVRCRKCSRAIVLRRTGGSHHWAAADRRWQNAPAECPNGGQHEPRDPWRPVPGWDDLQTWLTRVIELEEALLTQEQQRLAAVSAGQQPDIPLQGWPDPQTAQQARVHAQQEWIALLRDPHDEYLLRFLNRPDLGSPSWNSGFSTRRRDFHIKHSWEPSHERSRPRHARKRRLTAERRQRLAETKTSPIDRQAIYQRDYGTCGICGKPVPEDDFHLDHINPAGLHSPENLRVTHPVCNTLRGNPLWQLPLLPRKRHLTGTGARKTWAPPTLYLR